MTDTHTVLYVSSIDEATDLHELPLDEPENGEDWALVAHGDTDTRLEFVYSGETVTLSTDEYQDLRDSYDPAEEFTVENATEQVLDTGMNAIFDVKFGEPPLVGIEDELPKAVSEVFVMQFEQGERDWPDAP